MLPENKDDPESVLVARGWTPEEIELWFDFYRQYKLGGGAPENAAPERDN